MPDTTSMAKKVALHLRPLLLPMAAVLLALPVLHTSVDVRSSEAVWGQHAANGLLMADNGAGANALMPTGGVSLPCHVRTGQETGPSFPQSAIVSERFTLTSASAYIARARSILPRLRKADRLFPFHSFW